MTVTAITVTYNSADIVETALRCIDAHPKITACIVVDNASDDATVDRVRAHFPNVRIIRNQQNLGFGTACNQALAQVTTEFALLLNPDATIDADGIDRLLDGLTAYPNAAIAAPMLIGNSFDASTDSVRLPVIHDKHQPAFIPTADKHTLRVFFVSGAIALWRMRQIRLVGFFDPTFFLFYEDDDLSIRTRNAGYDMLVLSAIHATHTPGASCVINEALESMKLRSSTWSYLAIHRKYRGRAIAMAMAVSIIVRAIVGKGERGFRKKDYDHKRRGAWAFLCNSRSFNPHG